jgi:hypothetical protein
MINRAYIIARTSGIVVAGRALPCGGVARPIGPAIYGATNCFKHSRRKAALCPPIVDLQQELNSRQNETLTVQQEL